MQESERKLVRYIFKRNGINKSRPGYPTNHRELSLQLLTSHILEDS